MQPRRYLGPLSESALSSLAHGRASRSLRVGVMPAKGLRQRDQLLTQEGREETGKGSESGASIFIYVKLFIDVD